MSKHGVPGTAVAIVKDGRLVFARGYGTLDPATGDTPGPHSLFRIASVSKPITGATCMKMVQNNQLKLDEKVLGANSILGNSFGSPPYDARERAITVEQLLTHIAAGKTWNNKGDDGSGDPMFQKPNYDHRQLVGWVLDEREPAIQPGTEYDYSNFGFCVLGRVIEKKTGQSYEKFVQEKILKPCGITNMHIAGDRLSDRRHNEAVYSGRNAYSMKVRRMDAHGGWLASPIDLMRFLVRYDGFATKPDQINLTNFRMMVTGSSVNARYGKGWSINRQNYFHVGSFSGGGAILVRAGNGLSWALVMNTNWKSEADGMMWTVVNGIGEWPNVDFF
jgi:CubicO group peptidase (beta-lactamase class C family)